MKIISFNITFIVYPLNFNNLLSFRVINGGRVATDLNLIAWFMFRSLLILR